MRPSSVAAPAWRGVLKTCRLLPVPSLRPWPATILLGQACPRLSWTPCTYPKARILGTVTPASSAHGSPSLPNKGSRPSLPTPSASPVGWLARGNGTGAIPRPRFGAQR